MPKGASDLDTQAQNTQYNKMTQTPVPKLIVSLGIPTIISMLITNIYNMADTYFVSQLGTSASGATGVVFGLMAVLQAFGFMFGHGAGSIISRRLGKKDYESASRFASTSFFLAIAVGIVIGIGGILFLAPFMRMLGSTITILPYFFGITGIQTAQAIADVIAFVVTLPLTVHFLRGLPKDF